MSCSVLGILLGSFVAGHPCHNLTKSELEVWLRTREQTFEDLRIHQFDLAHRYEAAFAGTAIVSEDYFAQINYFEGGKRCEVSPRFFEKARDKRGVVEPTWTSGAAVSFRGKTRFIIVDDSKATLEMYLSDFEGVSLGISSYFAGSPVSRIAGFENFILAGTPEFDALCAEAKKLAGE